MNCPYCEKCHHTGLLPFIKNGRTIRNAFLDCECRSTLTKERSPIFTPDDIDYPVSFGYYRSLCRQHGWTDPGPDRPPEPLEPTTQEIIHIHRTSSMSKQEYRLLQQTALKVDQLGKVLNGYTINRRKPRGKY